MNGLQSREPELRQRLKKVQEDIQITRVQYTHIYSKSCLLTDFVQKQEQTLRNSTNQLRKEIERLNQEALIDAPVNVDFFEQSKAVSMIVGHEPLTQAFFLDSGRRKRVSYGTVQSHM